MKAAIHFTGLALLILGGLFLSGCGSGAPGEDAELDGAGGVAIERPEPPEQYAGMTNPLEGDPETIAAGETLYQANCSSCHGPAGAGNGPAAGGLEPPPADLAEIHASLSDAYLHWRIAEGGLMEPFNSVMPAWRGILSTEQIWQIIAYIRTW